MLLARLPRAVTSAGGRLASKPSSSTVLRLSARTGTEEISPPLVHDEASKPSAQTLHCELAGNGGWVLRASSLDLGLRPEEPGRCATLVRPESLAQIQVCPSLQGTSKG